jgi:cell division protein FtsQ
MVEPKLRARRIEVKRDQGRRRLRGLVALSAVTLIAVAAILISRSALADVDGLVVEGAQQSDIGAIEQATGIQIGEPLLEVDTSAVAERVEALPWIRSAVLRRTWFGDVVVTVEERVPEAVISTEDGGLVLVDSEGRQLDRVPVRLPGFVPVAGVVANGELGQPAPPETQAVLRTIEAMTEPVRAAVAQIVIDQGTLYLELNQGGRIKLGDDSSLGEKMISLETMLAHADLRCLWEIDVRVPSAPALTRVSAAGDPRASLTDLASCT